MNAPAVSVILPVFKNEQFLEELLMRIHASLDGAGYGHEVVCVNDHCPGSSWDVLQALACLDPRLIAIDLKENVGQHQAVLIGMQYAAGEYIAVMDADLQDPPETLPELVRLARGKAIVFAVRRGVHQGRVRMFTSMVFKQLLAWIARVPRDAGMFFVIPREVKDDLLRRGGRYLSVVAMLGAVDSPKISYPVERQKRKMGKSAYSSWKRLKLGVEALSCACALRGPVIDRTSCVRTVIKGRGNGT